MEPNIKVVNRHHGIPFDVYIGRGTKWGNPFSHIDHAGVKILFNTREEAIEAYELYLRANKNLLESLWELDGKTLGCSCLPLSCHGEVLVKVRKEQLEEFNGNR